MPDSSDAETSHIGPRLPGQPGSSTPEAALAGSYFSVQLQQVGDGFRRPPAEAAFGGDSELIPHRLRRRETALGAVEAVRQVDQAKIQLATGMCIQLIPRPTCSPIRLAMVTQMLKSAGSLMCLWPGSP